MAETAAKNQPTAESQAVYSTSYAFGGTTSTLGLQIWKALSERLLHNRMPMTAAELGEPVGLSSDQVEALFQQVYYQRFYGFKRFDSFEKWQVWANANGVLANLAARPPEEAFADEDEEFEDE